MHSRYGLLLVEAWRIFRRSRYVKTQGHKRYRGDARQICKQIISDCWNGTYYQTSTGHFCEFYMRDFGWSVDALLKLGHRDKVIQTLAYALEKYAAQGMTTTITPEGKCVDVFAYAPDTLAYLLRSLRVAGAHALVKKYRSLLEHEAEKHATIYLDKATGLYRRDAQFSSMKDEAVRESSTYDNCMLYVIARELDLLHLKNPFSAQAIKKQIRAQLWSGSYFYDDLQRHATVTGDSNVVPFWLSIFDDQMLRSALAHVHAKRLDIPVPLKYSDGRYRHHKLHLVSLFVKEYERTAIWMHMGMMYLSILSRIDKRRYAAHKKMITALIERQGNFLEVFDATGKRYETPFYVADEGMIWAANYLVLP